MSSWLDPVAMSGLKELLSRRSTQVFVLSTLSSLTACLALGTVSGFLNRLVSRSPSGSAGGARTSSSASTSSCLGRDRPARRLVQDMELLSAMDLLDASHEPMLLCDSEGRVCAYNTAASRWLPAEFKRTLLGAALTDLCHLLRLPDGSDPVEVFPQPEDRALWMETAARLLPSSAGEAFLSPPRLHVQHHLIPLVHCLQGPVIPPSGSPNAYLVARNAVDGGPQQQFLIRLAVTRVQRQSMDSACAQQQQQLDPPPVGSPNAATAATARGSSYLVRLWHALPPHFTVSLDQEILRGLGRIDAQLDSFQDFVLRIDFRGRVLHANAQFLRVFRYPGYVFSAAAGGGGGGVMILDLLYEPDKDLFRRMYHSLLTAARTLLLHRGDGSASDSQQLLDLGVREPLPPPGHAIVVRGNLQTVPGQIGVRTYSAGQSAAGIVPVSVSLHLLQGCVLVRMTNQYERNLRLQAIEDASRQLQFERLATTHGGRV